MPDVKQILVVDDHFEMLEFLRSMLETQSQDFQVLSVPSAEEGWLEILRTPFDLLITDLRLPGMSGFDLVRKVSKRLPDIPMIVITAYASEQGRQEASSLGVFRYFEKPLDTDSLISAVRIALGDDTEPAESDESVPREVRERVETLRTETSAAQIVLADITGHILLQLNESDDDYLDLPSLTQRMAHNIREGLIVADQLGGSAPLNVQYHAGSQVEMYSANIGRFYFVSVFFPVESRRSRFSTIWVYLQRGVNDLADLLPKPETMLADEVKVETRAPKPRPRVEVPPFSEMPSEEELPPTIASTRPLRPSVEESEPESRGKLISLEEAMSLGDLDLDFIGEGAPAPDSGDADLDAFWEDAISEADGGQPGGRLSIEEARRQGLLSSDFDAGMDE